ncbi:MAG: hypothetical protein J1E00_02950 [Oscillospiraceae bacterium]|nr:hypothetical protein [Oscillospiraceae bacterium]
MKKLNAIVFTDETEFSEHADRITTKLSGLPGNQTYLGCWGEIRSNDPSAVISAVSGAVYHFLASDKDEIFFGCCAKDYQQILAAIDARDCEVVKRSCREI